MNLNQNNEDVNDDDFLSGDNESKTYPNNQNNPNEGYNKQLSPRGNANIGGNESEYETSVDDERSFYYDIFENDENVITDSADIDSEEQEKSNNETRYNGPTRNGSHRNNYM